MVKQQYDSLPLLYVILCSTKYSVLVTQICTKYLSSDLWYKDMQILYVLSWAYKPKTEHAERERERVKDKWSVYSYNKEKCSYGE